MPLDGNIGRMAVQNRTIVTQDHPPVLLTGRTAETPGANGEGAAWPAGTILTRDENFMLTPWDGETGEPKGILIDDHEAAESGAAVYLAHGTAALTELKLADGSAPGAAELYALARAGLYGF